MEKRKAVFFVLVLVMVLSGCSSTQSVIRQGMTKNEVLEILGPPTALITRDGQPEEYLTYTLPVAQSNGKMAAEPYAISIVNGRVRGHGDPSSMGLSGPGF